MVFYELSKPQKAIYEMDRFIGGSVGSITGDIIFLHEKNLEKLNQTVNTLIKKNEILRTQIFLKEGIPMQGIKEFKRENFIVLTFDNIKEYQKFAKKKAKEPMDIFENLLEIHLFRMSDQFGLLLKMHHIIGDAWSLGIIANQFNEIYNNNLKKYFSYLNYLKTENKYLKNKEINDKKYWLDCFEKNNEINYFSHQTSKYYESKRKRIDLTKEETQKIINYCKKNNISEFSFFLSAISAYYYRITDKEHFYLGSPIINRFGMEEKNTIGTYVNTIPIAINIEENESYKEFLKSIQENLLSHFRHQKYLYSEFIKILREEKNHEGLLFDVIVSYQNVKFKKEEENEFKTNWYHCGMQTESLEIHIDDRENEGIFSLNYDYQTEKFTEEAVENLHRHLINIIDSGIKDDSKKLYELELLSEKEKNILLYTFNDTAMDYPKKCIHTIFEEQAKETPSNIALVASDKTLTYQEIDDIANKIANELIKNNVKIGDIVGMILPRRSYLIAAIFGILKSGGAYLPIDPEYPEQRINYLLKESQSRFIITTKSIAEKLKFDGVILYSDELLKNEQNHQPKIMINEENLFCALHTSGSTGFPKITVLTHSNIMNFMNATKYVFDGIENVISTTTVSFDVFIQETLLALCSGIKIIFLDESTIANQEKFENIIEKYQHCFLFQTPTKLEHYIVNSPTKKFMNHIDTYLLAGEVFQKSLYALIKNNSMFKPTVFNAYGPAETSVCVTYSKINSMDITIGKPIANTQIYILDKHQNIMPIDVIGELCIAGDGVGKGYLNQLELTTEKFIANPFGKGKLYKTGDLAKYREDGNIDYVGRNDFQVKIRGLRIELGEIETVFSDYEEVKQAVVVIQKDSCQRQLICGFYVSENEINLKLLRLFMKKKLPHYMIPHYFIRLENLPQTPSGKINRKALPKVNFEIRTQKYVAPITPVQKKIANLMSEVLNHPSISLNDDFFEMGGDSLKAIEFVSKAHSNGIYFNLQVVFEHPSVKGLCEYLVKGDRNHHTYNLKEFEKYECILSKNRIDTKMMAQKIKVGNLLITGATGFLGIHILAEYLEHEKGKAYCLVRGYDRYESKQRLMEKLDFYFGEKYNALMDKRIFVICGDMSQEEFSEIEIPKVDMIVHTAASVKHYGSYAYFHKNNVIGTQNIVDLAQKQKAKLIHISTLSISGNSMADQFDVYHSQKHKDFLESNLYVQQPLDNVYIRSKFEAELAVLDGLLKGVQANIIRVGNLTNRYSDYKFQINYKENAFLNRVKAFVEFGMMPSYLMHLYAEFSPIDDTAKAVMEIARHFNNDKTIFHVNSHKVVYFKKLFPMLKKSGVPIKIVSGEVFANAMEKAVEKNNTYYIYEALINDMDENKKLLYDSNISIKNDYTQWYLNKIGFEWSEIKEDYICGYVQYFKRLGYLGV